MDDTIGWLDSKRQGNEPSVQTLARVLMNLEAQSATIITELQQRISELSIRLEELAVDAVVEVTEEPEKKSKPKE